MGDSTILRQKVIKGGAYNSSIKELEILYDDKEFLDSAKPYIGFRVAWDNNKSIHKP